MKRLAILLSLSLLPLGIVLASAPPKKKPEDHSHHKPIDREGGPLLARLSAKLERPRRLLLHPNGSLYIVDSGAGTVLLRGTDGKMKTVAKELEEPSGIARDKEGNLYISNHANGEEKKGSVLKINGKGEQSVLVKDITGPKGMALDTQGNLYIALFAGNTVLRVDREGKVSTFAEEVPTPAGLVFDKQGNLYAASSVSGSVTKITPKGKVSELANGLQIPSDIAIASDGNLLVTNYAGEEISQVTPKGKVRAFATVPEGTIGITLDSDDNLYFVGWDYQLLIKRTTVMSIPCPHCKKKIKIRLHGNNTAREEN